MCDYYEGGNGINTMCNKKIKAWWQNIKTKHIVSSFPCLIQQLKKHEGFRQHPYRDSVGKLTIGYGRNLDDKGIERHEAEYLLMNDIAHAEKLLRRYLPWYEELDEVRQHALINMAFNLGVYGLLKFNKMLAAMKAKDYDTAGFEAMDSKWAKQVGPRAAELSLQIKTGKYKEIS